MLTVPNQCAAALRRVGEQIDRERILPNADVRCLVNTVGQCPHHLAAGGVAVCMNDAIVAVAPLARQRQTAAFLIELRPPFDQLEHSPRSLLHNRAHDLPVAQHAAGNERVSDVIIEAVVAAQYGGNSSLGISAVRKLKFRLGHDQNREFRIDFQRGSQPGQAAPDDQHIRKEMRHLLRLERGQISRANAQTFHPRCFFQTRHLPPSSGKFQVVISEQMLADRVPICLETHR